MTQTTTHNRHNDPSDSEEEIIVKAKVDDSREKILSAAHRMFAEKGLSGASVRAITNAAGVNHALIGYYFGSKVALYEEVLERASETMSAPKLEGLAKLKEQFGEMPIPLRELMDVYIRSFFDDYGNPESQAMTWLRFYGRCFSEPRDEVRRATSRSGSYIRTVFLAEFQKTLPNHSKKELVYRLGATIGMIAFWRGETGIMDDHFEEEEERHIDVDELVETLISMSCAAFFVPDQSVKSNSSLADIGQKETNQTIKPVRTSTSTNQPEERQSRRHRKRASSAG